MDNFFEIIIYLFIFFSLISSLFGKKKKKGEIPPSSQTGQRTQAPQPVQTRQEPVTVSKTEDEDYDILREIENLFKMENEEPEKPKKEIPKPVQREMPQQKQRVERTRIETEKNYKSKFDDYKKPVLDKKIEEQALLFEKNFYKKSDSNSFILDLRRKLRDPKTLKDAVVFAEIIGKRGSSRRR